MLIASDIHFGSVDMDSVIQFTDVAAKKEMESGDGVVILAGDLTQSATKTEYQAARMFVSALVGRGLRVVLTPGNHDFGNAVERRIVDPHSRARYASLARYLHDHWQRQSRELPTGDVHQVLRNDAYDSISRVGRHVFVALRSIHSYAKLKAPNRIRREQLEWVDVLLERMRRPDDILHFVTHRSLWSTEGIDENGHEYWDKHEPLREAERLGKHLVKHRYSTFIHGHNHRRVRELSVIPKTSARIERLSGGTLSDRIEQPKIGTDWLEIPLLDFERGRQHG